MPCLSNSFDPAIGPIINVGVLQTGAVAPAAALTAQINVFPALIDTGASITCISPGVAKTVALQPIGMRQMVSATQSVPVNIYLVDLFLPFGASGFIIQGAQVMEFSPASVSIFKMIVGRDIICQGALTISFDGHFTFCL